MPGRLSTRAPGGATHSTWMRRGEHRLQAGQGRRCGARRRRRPRGVRRHPAPARDPAQLPGRRAPALPARAVRPGAAPVHRHRQRRGAPVQPRPARAGSTPRPSGRTTTSGSAPTTTSSTPTGYPIIKHRTFAGVAAPTRAARGRRACRCRRPRCSAGRAGGAHGVPARVGRQHLGDELRLAVGQRRSRRSTAARRWPAACRTPARAALSPYHRNGGDLVFQIGTAYFGCRDEHGRFDLGAAQGRRRRRAGRAIEIKLSPGRQARPRRPAAGGQGDAGDRRDPRHPAGRGLRVAQPAHRLPRRRLDARLRRAARRRDRPAGRHQVGGRRDGLLGRAGRR